MMKKHVAIVLAAGTGSRMKSDIPKQYLNLRGKPVLYYSLKAFEESFVDEIILVTGEGWQEYCRSEIAERYQLKKVKKLLPAGRSGTILCIGRSVRQTGPIMFIFMTEPVPF